MQIQNLTQALSKQTFLSQFLVSNENMFTHGKTTKMSTIIHKYVIHNIQYHLTVQRQRQHFSCIISAADNRQRIEQSYTEVPAPATGMCTNRPDKAFGMLWENKYAIGIKANIIK